MVVVEIKDGYLNGSRFSVDAVAASIVGAGVDELHTPTARLPVQALRGGTGRSQQVRLVQDATGKCGNNRMSRHR